VLNDKGSLMKSLDSIVRSTYRALVRETQRLPHVYLSDFFRTRTTQYFRENILSGSISKRLLWRKVGKAKKELRKLQRANNGEKSALTHVIELAYGRKGKLHHELKKHYLTNPFNSPPPRIIPAVERSRPPSYSPELKVLLTSIHSRSKPLSSSALYTPPTLPQKADLSSEEARIFGPLSRRREVNIRWRYHTAQLARTYFPLELSKGESNGSEFQTELRPTGAEELELLREVETLARSPHNGVPLPRRQQINYAKKETKDQTNIGQVFYSSRPARFIRRRYAQLLSRIPILRPKINTKTECITSFSPLAIGAPVQGMKVPEASKEDIDWFLKGEGSDGKE